ncbi:MAG: exodeoxyribonuclease VII large subunit [Cyclobacteriaceae bacterium]|nr:exodeoxyribonuclease VII large subunit [Cyclobacteriaceae bacterium]
MSYITLFQLNTLIQSTLEQQLQPFYWAVAEISELRVAPKGHCYLELVEKDGEHLTAKIRANIWAYDYRNLSNFFHNVTGKKLQPGMKILAKVKVEFHEVFGMSLHIRDLDPNFTLGERARQRQLVVERLTREDLLGRNKQLALPLVPQRIAVISAETAAGYGDFMHQLVQNQWGYHFQVKLFKSVMQGTEAVSSINSSLEKIYQQADEFDLLVIIRGGGSQVDLDCFDHYELTAMVARSPLPVVTGIGHERDQTVLDLVAHTRLKTPTAVAEFLLSGMNAVEHELNELSQRLRRAALLQLQTQDHALTKLKGNLEHKSLALIQKMDHRQDLLQQKLVAAIRGVIQHANHELNSIEGVLKSQPLRLLKQEHQLLAALEDKIKLADPRHILKRGFTITYREGKVLKPGEEVVPGEEIETRTQTALIKSKVLQVNRNE